MLKEPVPPPMTVTVRGIRGEFTPATRPPRSKNRRSRCARKRTGASTRPLLAGPGLELLEGRARAQLVLPGSAQVRDGGLGGGQRITRQHAGELGTQPVQQLGAA